MTERPNVLVLAGGGVLGEAWMQGVLAGYEDATGHDFRGAKAFVGTSAGSIVSARLAAGKPPRRPGELPSVEAQEGDERGAREGNGRVRAARRLGARATAPFASVALAAGTRPGAAVRAIALSRASGGGDRLNGLRAHVDRSGARFDGRLFVVAVDRMNGRRVVFGAPGAPEASVGQAVQASCSIPWVFRPVRIGDREYVDGGAWSITNLDVAPAERGDHVLCLHPTLGLDLGLAGPFTMMRAMSSAGTALEASALRSRGVRVKIVGPDAAPAELMARGLMNDRYAADVLSRGYAQGRALGSR